MNKKKKNALLLQLFFCFEKKKIDKIDNKI